MVNEETRTEPAVVQPKTEPTPKKLSPEQIASRQRAHYAKVEKMLAGGEF